MAVAAIVVSGTALYLILFWLFLARMDKTLRSYFRSCHTCLATWRGTSKVCERCGSVGHLESAPPLRAPSHDWQGYYIDTQPISLVRVQPEISKAENYRLGWRTLPAAGRHHAKEGA